MNGGPGARLAHAGTCVLLLAAVAALVTVLADSWRKSGRPPPAPVILGAYTGPAARGAGALPRWERWSGDHSNLAIDFAAGDSWLNITGPAWSLAPWQSSGRRLIYSVPLFPVGATGDREKLAACASGNDDGRWTALARNLLAHRLSDTIVRPGWEFNGDWYAWAAYGRTDLFQRCFRQVVTAMRSVAGQHFSFLWNPNIGTLQFPAEQAYPGDAFVDIIGVDVYDTSWKPGIYPLPVSPAVDRDRVREAAFATVLYGDHGLMFWSAFAARHAKPFAVPEWGLSQRTDGHGGGDNRIFMDGMLTFLTDPAHGVAFAMYLDTDAPEDQHRLSSGDSPFPAARRAFRSFDRSRT